MTIQEDSVDGAGHDIVRTDPYLLVSVDGHVGPSLEGQLRDYCPKEYLERFDEYAAAIRRLAEAPALAPGIGLDEAVEAQMGFDELRGPEIKNLLTRRPSTGRYPDAEQARDRSWSCAGQQEIHARHADMDGEGIACEIVFAGG